MVNPIVRVLGFSSVPVATMATGGSIAAFWPPSPRVRSYLQHFAAGVVFAAAAVEVLPDLMHNASPAAATLGFALGVTLMLAIRALAEKFDRGGGGDADEDKGRAPWALIGVVGIDILVDGVLIGVMLAAGHRAGLLVTIALGVELLSLGLATSATLSKRQSSRRRAIVTTCSLALIRAVGAVSGYLVLGGLKGDGMEAVLGFAVAALLYLVTEELLVEAHEVPETAFTTVTFFMGFLGLLLLDMLA